MSPKVLFIGHYCEDSGWGVAGREYLHAMLAAGIDVTARPVFAGNPVKILPPEILEITQKSAKGCEVVIQNVLPHIMDRSGGFKRYIGLCYTETSGFAKAWAAKLNLMDRLWAPCTECRIQGFQSGVNIQQDLVPTPLDISVFDRSYERASLRAYPGDFKFYAIAENQKRKNFVAMLESYYLSFTANDPVSLIIKTNSPGQPPEQTFNEMQQLCQTVQNGLRLYGAENTDLYPRVEVITERLTDNELHSLHDSCDCFVVSSYGEGFCLPALQALGHGSPVLCTDGIGCAGDFVNDENGWLIDSTLTNVSGMKGIFSDLFTAREDWRKISVKHLSLAMKTVVGWRDSVIWSLKKEAARQTVKRYSREVIGKQIADLLSK